MPDLRQQRQTWFWLFTAGCVAAAAGYVVWRVNGSDPATSPAAVEIVDPATLTTIASLQSSPHLYFASARADHFMNAGVASIAVVEERDAPEIEIDLAKYLAVTFGHKLLQVAKQAARGHIDQGRRANGQALRIFADRMRKAVAPGQRWIVARRT